MEKNTYIYPAIFTYEDGYDIAVTFPDIELATQGEDEYEALEMAKDALGGRLYCMERDGDAIPLPTSLKDVELEKNEKVILVEVFMPAVRMAEINKSVTRTVTLPAWLSAEASKRGVNFSRVLQEALTEHLGLSRT